MDILTTLVSVLVGAIATGIASIVLTRITNRHQQQQELQNHRRLLMQQYLTCIEEFDTILNNMYQSAYSLKLTKSTQQPSEDKGRILADFNRLRALVIKASSILKATGDIQLAACGWMIYDEALGSVDETGVIFDMREYNTFHYFRVALDVGLSVFANTISNNLSASKELPSMELNQLLTEKFREAIREKYKGKINWSTTGSESDTIQAESGG